MKSLKQYIERVCLRIVSRRDSLSCVAPTAWVYHFTRLIDTQIDDYSYVAPYTELFNCTVGKFCSIGRYVRIGYGEHPVDRASTSPIFYKPNNPIKLDLNVEQNFREYHRTTIGNDVWIGLGSFISGGIKIGNGAIIAAHSVVTKDVAPYSIVGGVPTKVIRMRFEEEVVASLQDMRWWDWPLDLIEKRKALFSVKLDSSAWRSMTAEQSSRS